MNIKYIWLGLFILLINNVFNQEIGGECTLENGDIGFYDCELCCWDLEIFSWLGDNWCDNVGGCAWEGPQFNCYELGYDCGDCYNIYYQPVEICLDCCDLDGDLNCDNQVNILDVDFIITCILSSNNNYCADINHDSSINIYDIIVQINEIIL